MADNKGQAKPAQAPAKKEKPKENKAYKPGRQCPKCNSGMADHSDRYACGKCGYTEFKNKKQ